MKEQNPAHYIVNVYSFFIGYLIHFVRASREISDFLLEVRKMISKETQGLCNHLESSGDELVINIRQNTPFNIL